MERERVHLSIRLTLKQNWSSAEVAHSVTLYHPSFDMIDTETSTDVKQLV